MRAGRPDPGRRRARWIGYALLLVILTGLLGAIQRSKRESILATERAGLAHNAAIVHAGGKSVVQVPSPPALFEPGPALLVPVDRDLGTILAPWRRETALRVALLLGVGAIGAAGLLARHRRERVLEMLQGERALQESEERLRLATEGAEVGIWYRDLATDRGEWSPLCREHMGMPHGDVPGREDSFALMHPDDREKVRATIADAIEQRGSYSTYFRIARPDGHVSWIRSLGRIFCSAGGIPVRMGGITLDVTGLKEAEEALLRARERLLLATDGASLGIWNWDMASGRLEWSDRCKEHLALPPGREPGFDSFWAAIHPDDRERVQRVLAVAVERQQDFVEEYRIIGLDGIERWIGAMGRVYSSPDGAVAGMGGVTVDVTGRKAAAEAHRVSEERFRRFFEDSAVGMVMCDSEMRLVDANQAFSDFLGYTREELIGMAAADFTHPEHRASDHDGMSALLRGEVPSFRTRQRYLRRDGTVVWGSLAAAAIHDSTRTFDRTVATIEDVTKEVLAEESLHQSVARTEAANTELARATRIKDEFLATMSHELRTPLGAVLTMSSLLQEQAHGPLPAESLRQARVIEESGNYLLGLINDIIDVARIDAGKIEAEVDSCRLADVGQKAASAIQQSAGVKGLSVSLSVDPPDVTVLTDHRRLVQLLLTLLSNAVKFTPEGGGIGVEIAGDEAAGIVRIAVWDTGIGIAPEDLDKIFQPFVQLDARINRAYGGTGLGLALVERLARLIRATVAVESEAGRGCRFTVAIPWQPTAGSIEPGGADARGGRPLENFPRTDCKARE